MRLFRSGRTRFVAIVAAILVACGAGVAVAAMSSTPSNARAAGRGIPEFGLTHSYFRGHTVRFVYTRGFYCDTSIPSAASSKCEAGKRFKKAPAKNFDPLYILVPLGFKVPMRMDCPNKLVCVDHPGTMDLSRLEPALKPLYPTLTDAQLTAALKNAATPGHQHFITTLNNRKPEWWYVRVVGVTNRTEYNKIVRHRSAHYLKSQVKAGKTTGFIPTNLFLYFAAK